MLKNKLGATAHVIALLPDAAEAIGLKHPDESFIGDRVKLWHIPAGVAGRLAGW